MILKNNKPGMFIKIIKMEMREPAPKIARKLKINDILKLEKASEHIFYEISILILAYNYFIITNIFPPELQEVFLLHTRNLYNFFYPPKNIRYDDMCVYDFLDDYENYDKNRTPPNDFPKSKIIDINKYLSHLTYERCEHDYKLWDYSYYASNIIKTIKSFLNSLPDNYKKWDNFIKLNKLLNNNFN